MITIDMMDFDVCQICWLYFYSELCVGRAYHTWQRFKVERFFVTIFIHTMLCAGVYLHLSDNLNSKGTSMV